jgi:CheY-like chemotaxis protein
VSAYLAPAVARRRRSLADFWANFNLTERVHAYEARYVRRALIDAGGSVTRAARLLGLTHHANLTAILTGRHKDLAHLRTPHEKRLRSLIRERSATRRSPARAGAVRILHVEDNKLVADAVRDGLADMGWAVSTCSDGLEATEILAGNRPFDLMIFDYDLPGRTGLELIRHARTLPHRRRVPCVMFSAGDVEREAWREPMRT